MQVEAAASAEASVLEAAVELEEEEEDVPAMWICADAIQVFRQWKPTGSRHLDKTGQDSKELNRIGCAPFTCEGPGAADLFQHGELSFQLHSTH